MNKIKVWEAELYLEVGTDNRVYGHLGERPAEATGNEPYLTVEGKATFGEPLSDENGGAKVGHSIGGIGLLLAA